MARAFQQSLPAEDERDPREWQSLRHELVALLDQVDTQVARSRGGNGLSERVHDLRMQVAGNGTDTRHRDALRSVQRQISRFEEPPPPPNPRDSLQAAINQIRSRQGEQRPQAAPVPVPRATEAAVIDRLALSVNGLASRLEGLEGEIRAQIKTGTNIKDVADQVAQLAHVVELLAGAVGETGQVKRLEGQIASLGKLIAQGREMDVSALTHRLDDVATTVGKLAELQVHYADRVENPVASQAFRDGMRGIEESVRGVYDRIDALEQHASLSPRDLEHVTAEMARFTEALHDNNAAPQGLVELIDALNSRIADIENGDRLLQALRKDLNLLRDSVVMSLAPRFDAIEQRMDGLSTRDDMAEIGRQIGMLSDRLDEQSAEAGLGPLEAQVRQLVARMDQTGEQLSGLARMYGEPGSGGAMPDFDAMAEMVATRAAEAVERAGHGGTNLNDSIAGLESRIVAMLEGMRHDPETNDLDGLQAGISEVNERLKRLESSLRRPEPMAEEAPFASTAAMAAGIAAAPMPLRTRDSMPRDPVAESPLTVPVFPQPSGPVQDELERKVPMRKRHPGLEDDYSLAARHESPAAPVGFEPESIPMPAAPQPTIDFTEPAEAPAPEPEPAAPASTNTFIAAARRAAQRQQPSKPEVASNSLIGRALARFQVADSEEKPKAAAAKPARKEFKPEPVVPVAAPVAPVPEALAPVAADGAAKESFLLKHRKTILLAAAVVAVAFLTINLVAQRLSQPADAPAEATPAAAPATTGDIAPIDTRAADAIAASMPPRVIPLADTMHTGAIDSSVSPAFTNSPIPAMPSAFSAPSIDAPAAADADADADAPMDSTAATDASASLVATADPAVSMPSVEAAPAEVSPVKVDMPAEGVGPIELRQAAANGDPRAQFEVAAIYTEGRAITQDYAQAAIWYERAAAQGFAPAQYRLGSLYESGNGVAKDLDTARLWYEKAAEAGNRMAMHNLASLYAGGNLGKQQFDSAAKWFEEAADRGLTDSQFNLGMLYARGLGVPQSLNDSFKWFGIAALSGDKDATKARDDIARSLDADTMAKLTAEIAAFKPAPIDLAANFAPIGTWMKNFDPGETITTKDIVLTVQKALSKLGYDVGTPDGIAGKKTADAVKAFEGATGMSQVGLINPRLLAVLGSQPV